MYPLKVIVNYDTFDIVSINPASYRACDRCDHLRVERSEYIYIYKYEIRSSPQMKVAEVRPCRPTVAPEVSSLSSVANGVESISVANIHKKPDRKQETLGNYLHMFKIFSKFS